MSFRARAMFVDGDRIIRVPLPRLDRLFPGDPNETMPEWAYRRMKCALVYVEIVKRKPVAVIKVDHTILAFGPDGQLDQAELHREGALAAEMLEKTLFPAAGLSWH